MDTSRQRTQGTQATQATIGRRQAGMALGSAAGPLLAQTVQGVSASSIKIGVTLALTGPVAQVHTQLRAGQQAYIDMVNERGGVRGRKIELLFRFSPTSHQGTNALYKMAAKGGRWIGTGEVVDSLKNSG